MRLSAQENYLGRVFPTNNGGKCIVVDYVNSENVTVMFLDKYGHTKTTRAGNVTRGCVSNPFYPTVYGIGYLGVGKHKTKENKVRNKVYTLWKSMLERCYSESFVLKNPTYEGCTVCEEWHNFQVFAEWYCAQEFGGIGYDLDKDILSKKVKIYSPETCCFLPKEINTLFNENKASRTNMPQGVYLNKKTRSYTARLSIGAGKKRHLGTHKTSELAFKAYKIAKESYVKEVALKWKDKIEPRVFEALMNWTVE
ncbi:hypothetical protein [Vibrio phage vB_VhaM_VH-8]|nr:hypothetical protein [Vibrio phage vB_VhaM_VH-8]